VLTHPPDINTLPELVRNAAKKRRAEVGLGVILIPGETQQTLHIALLSPEEERQVMRTYGGPPQLAPRWGVNLCLDLLRKL